MPLVTLQKLTCSHGGPPLFAEVDLAIETGDRIGLLGRNGTGKTTLLRLIQGEIEPTAGAVFREADLRIATMAQRLPDAFDGSVFDVVADGLGSGGERLKQYHHLTLALADGASNEQLGQLDRLQRQIERDGGFAQEQKVDSAISRIGLDPDSQVASLSVGMKRRVLLAQALASEPQLLILDEPTNHLDLEGIEWLETFLSKFTGAFICVTHDRAFLRSLANRIVYVDRGRVKSYACDYDTAQRRRGEDLEAEQKAAAELDRKLKREEEWDKQGIKARRTKAVARVKALEKLREERRSRARSIGTARVETARVERSGNLVAELLDVSFAYDGGPALIDGLTTMIMRGDKVGVMGPNGTGKTTLLRLILGELEPTRGTIRHGVNLEIGVFDQLHRNLDDDATVAQNITPNDFVEVGDGRRRHIIGYCQGFLFSKEQIKAPVRHLSGGERNRVLLARLFARPSNLLVLDEPTNDLDAETIEVLEERLVDYPGTVLLVSHDREFLNNVLTSTLVLEGNGRVGEYFGGYDDWLVQRPSPAEPQPAKKATATTPSGRDRKTRKSGTRMLSRAEREELAGLPGRIETLEAELARLHEKMGDPTFYSGDPQEIGRATGRLKEVQAELETTYARWEELDLRSG